MALRDPALVVWTGPVGASDVPGATVPGAALSFIGCRGDITPDFPYCPGIGDQLAAGGVSALLAKVGFKGPLGDLFFGAFSAGGSLLKRILMAAAYRAQTRAVLLSDATWTTWASPGVPLPMEGFVQYALDVIAGGPHDKLFIATASPNANKTYPTGHQSLRATQDEIAKRAGKSFVKLDRFFGVDPQPDETWALGNVIFAYYAYAPGGVPLGHAHFKLAPQVWEQGLVPWLAGTAVDKGDEKTGVGLMGWLALLLGAAGGYAAARRIVRATP